MIEWQESQAKQSFREASAWETSTETSPRKRRFWERRGLLLLALCLGLFIEISLARMIFTPESSDSKVGKVVTAAVAVADLSEGHTITESDFKWQTISSTQCGSLAVAPSDKAVLVGHRLEAAVSKGAIFPAAEVRPSESRRLLDTVPIGKRLFVLPQPANSELVRLRRGDVVDIVGHLQLPQKGFVTKALLQAVPVAWSSQQPREAQERAEQSLAFYLSANEVDFLVQARKFGRFEVVFRNPHDTEREQSDGMTENEFINDPRIRDVYENDLFQIKR